MRQLTLGILSITIVLISAEYSICQYANTAILYHPDDQSEVSIEASPIDTNILFAAWNDFRVIGNNTYSKPGFGFSTDGGTSWTTNIVLPPGWVNGFDPVAAFDGLGRAYYCYIARDSILHKATYISRTTNFGSTWSHSRVKATEIAADKPWMAIDLSNDRIYVTWTDFSLGYYTARIMFAHSTDGGSSFILYNGDGVLVQPTGTYLPAYPDTVRSTPALGVVPNPIVEVGSTGEVYVVYLDEGEKKLRFRKSIDGGATFGPLTNIIALNPVETTIWGCRIHSYGALNSDANNGNLYLAYVDDIGTPPTRIARIRFMRSLDGASTWSAPMVIGDVGYGWQFMPWITVAPDGEVSVSFLHDTTRLVSGRYVPDSILHVYTTTSLDEGLSFQIPIEISDTTMNDRAVDKTYDYMGITSTIGRAQLAWTDPRNGRSGNGNADVYKATIASSGNTQSSNNSTATAYGTTSKTLYNTSDGSWNVIYSKNNDLYHTYTKSDGYSWILGPKISGNLGGIQSNSNPALVQDAARTLHVVFSSNGNGVYYTKKPLRQNWITPIQLYSGSQTRFPTLVVDANGVGHVAFVNYQSSGEYILAPANNYRLYYGTFNTGSPGLLSIQKQIHTSTSTLTGTSLAQMSNGQLHVVWSRLNEIYHSSGSGSSWSTALNISNSSGNSEYPSIVAMVNVIQVVWQDNTPGNYEIYLRTYNGNWSSIENVSNNAGHSKYPQIKLSAYWGGYPFIFWSDNQGNVDPNNYDIWYALFPLTPVKLTNTSSPSLYPGFTERTTPSGLRFLTVWTEGSTAPFSISSTYFDNPFAKRSVEPIVRHDVPDVFSLSQNFPNPFNPITTIGYGLPEPARVTIKIFNILGQEVLTLLDEYQEAGYERIHFDGSQLPSGVYIYRMQAGSFNDLKKMVLIK